MSHSVLRQIRQAIEQLNPNDVREAAERPVVICLHATSSEAYAAMEDFFAPATVSRNKRYELVNALHRAGDPGVPAKVDVAVYEPSLPVPAGAFVFDPPNLARDVLAAKEEWGLPLARLFPPFRKQATDKIVFGVSKENAVFAVMTALPDLMPGVQIPWSVPEAFSDAAVLTVNQIRMAFLLAAASDRPVGYLEQKAEVASIIAGALGWRAIARELVSKVPFGGGILPKAAIAFAGTYVEGLSLERLYRLGYGYTRAERKLAYGEALTHGREVAREIWDSIKRRRGERLYKRAVIPG
jgi:hypothetical protein